MLLLREGAMDGRALSADDQRPRLLWQSDETSAAATTVVDSGGGGAGAGGDEGGEGESIAEACLGNLSRFAVSLNAEDGDLLQAVAPTDSRLRPDIRSLERGDWAAAEQEKLRVEERQRTVRAERKRHGSGGADPHDGVGGGVGGGGSERYRPRWFRRSETHRLSGRSARVSRGEDSASWQYGGDYWELRTAGEGFGQCMNIFDAVEDRE